MDQNTKMTDEEKSQINGIPMESRHTLMFGLLIVLLFFGGFGGWSILAPIASGAVATGQVQVDSKRKTVQHFEGGIVSEILVSEGESVAAGQVLIRLDDTQAAATKDLVEGQLISARVLEGRLVAERDGLDEIVFMSEVDSLRQDPRFKEAYLSQWEIFQARRTTIRSQASILGQKEKQIQQEIVGLEAEIKSQTRELELLEADLNAAQTLLEKGLIQSTRVTQLQRDKASLEGGRARNRSSIARARQDIGEAQMRVSDLMATRQTETVEQLGRVRTEIADLEERLRSADDILGRTDVMAPVSGIVVSLTVFTQGGVISPGQALMEIVPQNDRLVVEARIRPTDVDVVYKNMEASVRLLALNQRTTPTIKGVVERVSADSVEDERTGEIYYSALVSLDPDEMDEANVSLLPGMPAEVMILTGSRTLFEYVTRPIQESIARSLREE